MGTTIPETLAWLSELGYTGKGEREDRLLAAQCSAFAEHVMNKGRDELEHLRTIHKGIEATKFNASAFEMAGKIFEFVEEAYHADTPLSKEIHMQVEIEDGPPQQERLVSLWACAGDGSPIERIKELLLQNDKLKRYNEFVNVKRKEQEEVEGNIKEVRAALNKINNWLVCAAIATPEDMAQSFGEMQREAARAIELLK